MGQNRLKIQAQSLDLELTGEPDYVREAYAAIRPVLLQRFERSIREAASSSEATSAPERTVTQPLYRTEQVREHLKKARTVADQHMRLVVCSELYHKVSVLHRDELEQSIFGELIDVDQIEHLYINEADAELLEGQIKVGRTLWRELTARGRTIVQGDSS